MIIVQTIVGLIALTVPGLLMLLFLSYKNNKSFTAVKALFEEEFLTGCGVTIGLSFAILCVIYFAMSVGGFIMNM